MCVVSWCVSFGCLWICFVREVAIVVVVVRRKRSSSHRRKKRRNKRTPTGRKTVTFLCGHSATEMTTATVRIHVDDDDDDDNRSNHSAQQDRAPPPHDPPL